MMSKSVYVLRPHENWIVDRLVSEWLEYNSDIVATSPNNCDTVWLLADWCWKSVDVNLLKKKRVVTTVHHIVPQKFDDYARFDFKLRDSVTDIYHVPNVHTKNFLSLHTDKDIVVIPYWANQNIWKKSGEKSALRKKYGIDTKKYVIGSFQRDTEGNDLISPKMEKGPDLFCDFVEKVSSHKDVLVLLAGWRRQYVISRLDIANISYAYFEMPDQTVLNDLYQVLDLYPVTSRYEGGPQSLIECGLLDVPVVSRDVGIASALLPASSISDDILNASPSIPQVENLRLPKGFLDYRRLLLDA